MVEKTALITGITGQDGSYLAELLLMRGYRVVGTTRQKSAPNIAHLADRLVLLPHHQDIKGLMGLIEREKPSEIYNFAGQTHVSRSWDMPDETIEASAVLPANILEAIARTDRGIRFFQASSSEIFSLTQQAVFDENTPIAPGTPYGSAKAYAHHLVTCYRENYGIYAVNGILFNHESPRRSEIFASRKIVKGAVAIKLGHAQELVLGNVEVSRDWSYAPDVVEAVHEMLQMEKPVDLVISSGESYSLADMVRMMFEMMELDHEKYLRFDPALYRVAELPVVRSSNAKARQLLNWSPRHSFRTMLERMVAYEMRLQTGRAQNFAGEHPFT